MHIFLAGACGKEKANWVLNGENQMITCSLPAGDAGFVSSLQKKRPLEAVSRLLLVIVKSDLYLHKSNRVDGTACELWLFKRLGWFPSYGVDNLTDLVAFS